MSDNNFPGWHGTTIVSVRKGNKVVVAGDGQVSMGQTVMKHTAKKVRRLAGLEVLTHGKWPHIRFFPDRHQPHL